MSQSNEIQISQFWEKRANSKHRIKSYMIRNLRSSLNVFRNILKLSIIDAQFSSGPEGIMIADALMRRLLFRFDLAATGACILLIPNYSAEYLKGSDKQTLRRKIRAAEKAGVTCRLIDNASEQCEIIHKLDFSMGRKSDDRYRELNSDHSFLIGLGFGLQRSIRMVSLSWSQ